MFRSGITVLEPNLEHEAQITLRNNERKDLIRQNIIITEYSKFSFGSRRFQDLANPHCSKK